MTICFSGTGNSRLVANKLAENLADTVVIAEGNLLINPANETLSVEPSSHIVWVFPTYSWGVPPVFVELIKQINIQNADSAQHFMVTTCGDDIGRCQSMWRKLIEGRNWMPAGAWSVQMPNTYVCMKGFNTDPTELAAEKLSRMPARVDEISEKIKHGSTEIDVVAGSWQWAKTAIIYPWFKQFEMNPRKFTCNTDACISCGKCWNSCPMNNITPGGDKHPQWKNNCAFCLRCYHICPVHAIGYNSQTENKGQYLAPKE